MKQTAQTDGKRLRTLLYACIALALLQLLRVGIKQTAFLFFSRTIQADTLAGLAVLCLLIPAVVLGGRALGLSAHLRPQEGKSGFYCAALAVLFALLLSGPLISGDTSGAALTALLYGAVVTPVYEELIFRGYLWDALQRRFTKAWKVCLITALLFGLWHLGYADTVLWRAAQRGEHAVWSILLRKVAVGLCYGAATGLARWKSGNCLAGMLLHAALNVFGR